MLSIDGIHIEKDLGLHLLANSSEPMLPSTRDSSVVLPGMHGQHSFQSYFGPLPLTPSIMIPDQATLRDVQRIIRNVSRLILDDWGRPKEVKLIYDYKPNEFFLAKFSGSVDPNRIAKAGLFTLPFVADKPWAFSIAESREINTDSKTVTADDEYAIDTVWVEDVQITSSQTLEAYINGYALRPTILITGSGNNVTFQANGKSFSLKNFSDASFEIIGEDYTLFKNGVNGFNEKMGRDFIELLPGPNQIQITGSNMNFNLSIRVRDQHM